MTSPKMEALEPRQFLSAAAPNATASTPRLIFSQVQGGVSAPQWVTLTNTGGLPLALQSVSISGADAGQFAVSRRRLPAVLAPGASTALKVSFAPTGAAVSGATLDVATNDPDSPVLSVTLRGLGVAGRFENFEPSLQRVLDAYQIPVNVGDANPATSAMDGPGPGEEVLMPLLRKAGPGVVRVSLLAVFSWESSPIAEFGWYRARGRAARSLFVTPAGNGQTLAPSVTGVTRFDPGSVNFGLFSTWPIETHGSVYSEDAFNTWDPDASRRHKVRFYPYKKPSGRVVPNTYVVAMEEAFNNDFQDAVLVVENVKPFDLPDAPTATAAAPAPGSPGAIRVTWADGSDNETGFVVERARKKNGVFSVVGTVGANVLAYEDRGLPAGTLFYYRVRAVNGARSSAVSSRAAAAAD